MKYLLALCLIVSGCCTTPLPRPQSWPVEEWAPIDDQAGPFDNDPAPSGGPAFRPHDYQKVGPFLFDLDGFDDLFQVGDFYFGEDLY